MELMILGDAGKLGKAAADLFEGMIGGIIAERGTARILLSTGASQFTTFEALRGRNIDWHRVEAFHLDEYIGISDAHPASFRKYLRERFEQYAPGVTMHYINTEGDIAGEIDMLGQLLAERPVDIALIGIGENAHIAFNDPPADFASTAAYKVVELDDVCKAQQVREGWFASGQEVPRQALTITPSQIMKARHIISCVPGASKAKAIAATLASTGPDPMVPASLMLGHPSFYLLLDEESAALVKPAH